MIAHFADLQLGFDYAPHGRTLWRREDFRNCFFAAIEETIRREASTVMFVGDIFHFSSPRRQDLLDFQDGLRQLRDALPDAVIIAISGNHDTPKTSTDVHPLAIFDSISNVWCVYALPIEIDTPDGTVMAVPWGWGQPLQVLDSDADILAVHAPILSLLPAAARASQLRHFDPEIASRFQYVALGDIHSQHPFAPNVNYPGSLERTSFDAADKPCGGVFVTLDSGGAHSDWWASPARPMHDIAIDVPDEAGYRAALNATFGDMVEPPLVRLTVSGLDPTVVDLGVLAREFPTVKTVWADSPEPPVLSSFSPGRVQRTWKTFSQENQLPKSVCQIGCDALQAATVNQ